MCMPGLPGLPTLAPLPPQPCAAGLLSSSLAACLSGGGCRALPAEHGRPATPPPRTSAPVPSAATAFREDHHKMPVNTPNESVETWPHQKCPLLTDLLKEANTMFLVNQRECPHQAFILLNGRKFLHVRVRQNLYQFEAPQRYDVERAITTRYAPALLGAVFPGAVCLLNTPHEIDNIYAHASQENDEGNMPNARAAQHLIMWINQYLADIDERTGRKPAKNPVAAYVLSQWHPPVWMAAKGKVKHENYKPSITRLAPQPTPVYEECQTGHAEAHKEAIIPREPTPTPQAERPLPVEARPPVVITPQITTATIPIGYMDDDEMSSFPGVSGPIKEGFVLEGYFTPRFCYDSNWHGWRRNFACLFTIAGWYRAIVENEGLHIVPGARGGWTISKEVAPSPTDIARYLTRNGLSFQEANNLYSWSINFLIDKSDAIYENGRQVHDSLTRSDYEWGSIADQLAEQCSLEYYLEHAQELGISDFRKVEPVPANVQALSGVKVVGGVLAATNLDNWEPSTPAATTTGGHHMDVDDGGPAPM
ncbi:hypothetical protein EDD17DRAFT_1514924 [Pisolithus thermaeus]|nr:hypothetical protein EDD17DRAFT_1514924 [Pisolithus thermaeus]